MEEHHFEQAAPAVMMDRVCYARRPQEEPMLQDVSLTIQAGEWVSVIGRNGCGKSTLAKLLAGLLPLSGGSVSIDGTTVTAANGGALRERVGIVFANPDNQFVGMSVAEDIVFGMENRCWSEGRMRERLHEVAERLSITQLLDRHPAELSGGQKQRVAIAAILATAPSIIIFDEATAMLDEPSKREVLALMREMRERGGHTLIAITHETDEMLAGDRLIALANGRIAAMGEPDVLLRDEALLSSCSIETPYYMKLSRALREKGCDIGEHLTDRSFMEALRLWQSNSRTSLTVTRCVG
jgi:energy-coupling factor transport system ATP-binding protein